MSPNPYVDPDTGLMTEFETYRGIGECGQRTELAWNAELRAYCALRCWEQPECTGEANDWPLSFEDPNCAAP